MTAPTAAASRPEITGLTGLRAFAALWVVIHHHGPFFGDELGEPWVGILKRGYLGVDLFFTLSGFVLAYQYGDRVRSAAAYGRFVALRIARLYPLHLATLALVVGLSVTSGITGLQIGSPQQQRIDHHLILHLLMIHGWGFESGLRYNRVSWSISAELFAYLLFPLLWACVVRFRRPVLAAAASLASVAATVGVLRALGHPSLHVPSQHALVRVTGEFLAGALAYQAWRTLGHPRLPAVATSAVLLGAAGLVVLPWADPALAFLAPALMVALAAGQGPVQGVFTARPVVYLGRISYSIYLTHLLVLSALRRLLPGTRATDLDGLEVVGVLVVHAVAILGVAVVSFHGLEWPARQRLRAGIDRVFGRNP